MKENKRPPIYEQVFNFGIIWNVGLARIYPNLCSCKQKKHHSFDIKIVFSPPFSALTTMHGEVLLNYVSA